MKNIVQLQTLSLSFDELLLLVYNSTGKTYYFDLKHISLPQIRDFQHKVFNDLKDVQFEACCIFTPESIFHDLPYTGKKHQIKEMYDKALQTLRYFREYDLNLYVQPNIDDLALLYKVSPPLFLWLKGSQAGKKSFTKIFENEIRKDEVGFLEIWYKSFQDDVRREPEAMIEEYIENRPKKIENENSKA